MKRALLMILGGMYIITFTAGSTFACNMSNGKGHQMAMGGMDHNTEQGVTMGGMSQGMDHGTTTGEISQDMGDGKIMKGMGHDTHQKTSTGHGAMNHSERMGKKIHTLTAEGYQFDYHLMDMREKLSALKATGSLPKEMEMTHHLMVYIDAPEGKTLKTATVSFHMKGPNASKLDLNAMRMGNGFGADVNLPSPGAYTMNTKAVVDGKTLTNVFTYTLK